MRAVSGRALGATVKGMGEECFNDLMPWLLETLTAENSSVDRSGAAQGKEIGGLLRFLKNLHFFNNGGQHPATCRFLFTNGYVVHLYIT